MKRRSVLVGISLLISTAALLGLLNILNAHGPGIKAAQAVPPDATFSSESTGSLPERQFSLPRATGTRPYATGVLRQAANSPITSSGGITFDLHGFDAPFNADWGYWCETDTVGSNAACADYGLLASNVVTAPHHGDSGASLKLSYAVTQVNTLASHDEHLYNGDVFYDLNPGV
jgi:hypothetical protein